MKIENLVPVEIVKGEPNLLREIAAGGLHWPARQIGQSFSVPNGTPFHIREGLHSNKVIGRGKIVDGWVVTASGKKYDHMNKAVLAIIGSAENAFRVVDFLVDDDWVSAEKLRSHKGPFDSYQSTAFSYGIKEVRKAVKMESAKELGQPALFLVAARWALQTYYSESVQT